MKEAKLDSEPLIKLPVVRARRSWHWTCPECNWTQIAAKSSTHTTRCKQCSKRFTVSIIDK